MLKEMVVTNRSYRRFDHTHKISREQALKLIDLARLCPSAANLQPLRYLILTEQDDLDKIFPHLRWAGYLRYWNGPEEHERPTAYILILSPASASKYVNTDAGIVAQTILLGAVEMGLGGCMLASMDKDEIMNSILPDSDLEPILCVALGKPAETIVIEDVIDPEDIEYYRDAEGIHHVPKRKLQDLLIVR